MDGSVYIEADGEPEVLDQLVSWCKQGPSSAYVDDIKVDEIPFNNYKTFGIK